MARAMTEGAEQMRTGEEGALAPREEKLLRALLEQPSIAAAAKAVGYSDRHARRLMAAPAFREAWRTARAAGIEQAVAVLHGATGKAALALVAILDDDEAGPGAKIAAARIVLEMSARYQEIENISGRLEAVEARLAALGVPAAGLAGSNGHGMVRR